MFGQSLIGIFFVELYRLLTCRPFKPQIQGSVGNTVGVAIFVDNFTAEKRITALLAISNNMLQSQLSCILLDQHLFLMPQE
ncbi:hypothetical protein [Chrysiogenes arsenatis]|uniref:hypothetical protein n=1 Tax=Chrysiogenes arsenatis TaxID=309797 RepID=UPI00040C0425|nr:hypothetical protein [Chrysiogenes arsenatis]